MSALNEAHTFVAMFGERHGVDARDVLRLQLIVEELFSNTVSHGYGGECDEPIELELELDDDGILLVYQDAARAHNPLATLPVHQTQLDAPLEDRPVGKIGVVLIAGIANDVSYTFASGRNRLQIRLRVGASA